MSEEPVEIDDITIETVTEDAVLFEYEGHAFWVPRSILGIRSEDKRPEAGDVVDITIPYWKAKQEGLA